mmetsp:Transcript_34191/g.69913  ORF Transcript_34191/g.69913 Transcript_34191/m.69913 type:complete len:119 (-) Transcript_34191:1668-2024(-)
MGALEVEVEEEPETGVGRGNKWGKKEDETLRTAVKKTRSQKLAQNIHPPNHPRLPTHRNPMPPPLEQGPQTNPRQRTMDCRRRCHSGTSGGGIGCQEVVSDCAAFAREDWEAVSGTVA